MGGITIIVSGNEKEIRKWMAWYQMKRGKKINYVGAGTDDRERTMIIKEGDKEKCPHLRTFRKLLVDDEPGERSEQVSE